MGNLTFFILVAFVSPALVLAHAGHSQGAANALAYMWQGVLHIVPLGLDHILFVAAFFFAATTIWQVVRYSLVFTVAHSITLLLAAVGVLHVPSAVIEPLIALSIFVLAIDLIRPSSIPEQWHEAVIFGFGLLHGLGFASVFGDLVQSETSLLAAVFSFNIGVELGQLLVLGILVALLWEPMRTPTVRQRCVHIAGLAIAGISGWWFLERVLLG